MDKTPNINFILCCYSDIFYFFEHIIKAFQYEFNQLNISCEICTDINIFLNRDNCNNNSYYILFGGQNICQHPNFNSFLKNNKVIIYNTEQLQSMRWDYFIHSVVENCYEWWDYSNLNIRYLTNKIGRNKLANGLKIKHIYFGYSKCLELLSVDDFDSNLTKTQKLNKDKILFFGTYHERRREICEKLNSKLINCSNNGSNNLTVEFDVSHTIKGEKYNQIVSANMIYLNLHFYIPSILEIVRIVPLLCQGHLVITERSDDKEMDELFSPYVIWLDEVIDDIDYLKKVIENHDNNRCKEKFSKEINFREILVKNLFDLS
jgi:hypothetical protein